LHYSGIGEELVVLPKAEGSFQYTTNEGLPTIFTVSDTQIVFDCPSSSDYTFRFTYEGRFKLSDAAPTNTLLTNHPDVYLAASIVWGSVYVKDIDAVASSKTLLDEFIQETNHQYAKSKKSVLTVDNALRPRRGWDMSIGDYR
jgi:hypothetical protein